MSRMARFGIGLAFMLGLACAFWIITPNMPQVLAQNTTTTGEWKATIKKEDSKIQLNLERRSQRGGRNQMGQSYEFSELQGLTREQALSGGPVKFSIVREAGRIDLEGTFQDGKGSGTFTFTGNPAFLSAMKSRGFDFEAHEKRRSDDDGEDAVQDSLFTATALNITTALADDLNAAGFTKLTVGDLFKAAIFKIDSQFAREMKASGFENLGMDELVKARIFKIDASFVRQVSQMGFE